MPSDNASAPRRSANDLTPLLVLNALLLGLLAAVTFSPAAEAQFRARGAYTMAAGTVKGSDSKAVYVVDTANQEMIAVVYNPNTKLLDGLGYRNLAADAVQVVQGRSRSGN